MRFDPDFTPDPLSGFVPSFGAESFGPRFAKLIEGKVIPCTLNEWVKWKEDEDDAVIIVARDETGTHLVSTVFLGLNHGYFGNVRAVWFETMIFDKSTQGEKIEFGGTVLETKIGKSIYCDRYSSLEEAYIGHGMALAWLKEELGKKNGAPIQGRPGNEQL
jgi:hypothetical protein